MKITHYTNARRITRSYTSARRAFIRQIITYNKFLVIYDLLYPEIKLIIDKFIYHNMFMERKQIIQNNLSFPHIHRNYSHVRLTKFAMYRNWCMCGNCKLIWQCFRIENGQMTSCGGEMTFVYK